MLHRVPGDECTYHNQYKLHRLLLECQHPQRHCRSWCNHYRLPLPTPSPPSLPQFTLPFLIVSAVCALPRNMIVKTNRSKIHELSLLLQKHLLRSSPFIGQTARSASSALLTTSSQQMQAGPSPTINLVYGLRMLQHFTAHKVSYSTKHFSIFAQTSLPRSIIHCCNTCLRL